MKKIFFFIFLTVIVMPLQAMDKPKSSSKLPKDLIPIINSYTRFEPAIERIKIWLKTPGNQQLDENPLFMEELLNVVNNRFRANLATSAILLGTPGAHLWLQTRIAQEKQRYIAQKGIETKFPITQQLSNAFFIAFENKNKDLALSILKDYPEIAKLAYPHGLLLNLAVSKNFIEVVELLLAQGAPVNMADKAGLTPLVYAVLNDNKRFIRILLSAGADPNVSIIFNAIEKVTPLMIATDKNSEQAMTLLIEAGARMDTQDANGNTVLMRALLGNKNNDIILLLLNSGSNLEIKNKAGETALIIAMKATNRIDIVQEFLNRGAIISNDVLKVANELPESDFKKTVLESLQEKQANPGKIFGEKLIFKKL